ncbi:lysozyme inhibitor LprI family protein [Aliisedimentitalea scapharcae]|uniref:Lysozyme inhibitor LprI family protein n=1 Tax=Aliisedimentitalea scapharcae TaxID=1524259 RepID=A0ABZ2XX96_9RHOB
MRLFFLGVVLTFGSTSVALAQDCSAPQTQSAMNECAAQFYRFADEDLNLAYGLARDMAKQIDTYAPSGQVSSVTLLRDAQRAWITYRDLACSAETMLAAGGSMQPLLHFGCLERLTRARTEDLRSFGEVN